MTPETLGWISFGLTILSLVLGLIADRLLRKLWARVARLTEQLRRVRSC
jgi:hypothetical protein